MKISKVFTSNESVDISSISEKLNERERLGSTGVGDGVAILDVVMNTLNSTLNRGVRYS